MRKLPVIVFALFFAIGAECGDNVHPRCDELDECKDLSLFCKRDGTCDCPGVGTCLMDPAP